MFKPFILILIRLISVLTYSFVPALNEHKWSLLKSELLLIVLDVIVIV